jgi:kynurenine formamidase
MRSRPLTFSSIALFILMGATWAAQTPKAPPTGSSGAKHPAITKQQVDTWMKELSNWGRWGKDDQLGTMNLVTDAKHKQAVALAKTGTVVSLAHQPPIIPKSQAQSAGAFLQIQLNLLPAAFTTEEQQIAFHGSSFTHLDALCHGDYDGKIYNGYPLHDSITPAGCKKLGIDALHGGVVTRGVLIDIPRLKGVSHLEPGTPVYKEDIEAWEKQAGVTISSGDAIFLHTGRWETGKTSGYDVSLIPWLKQRDVALVSSDGIQDITEVEGTILPLHHYTLVALGANILDNADLTALSQTAARLKRWEFLFVTAPIATPGGTGSPVNPLAIF